MRKREKIIDTALELFSKQGFQATSLERIVQDSGVAKMTLYKNFKNKEELILAVMHRKDETWRNWLMQTVEAGALTPKDRLLFIFDCLEESIQDGHYRGCFFIAAAQEYPHFEHAIHAAAIEHKRLVKAYILELLGYMDIKQAESVATQICIVMEGVMAERLVRPNSQAALMAKDIVNLILHNAETA